MLTFKTHAKAAIRAYENGFSHKKPMNAHRAKDVLSLIFIVNNDDSENGHVLSVDDSIDALIESLEAYLATIKTGVWIFKTGRSRLKDNLNDVFKAYKNPLLRSLHASLKDVGPWRTQYEAALSLFNQTSAALPISNQNGDHTETAPVLSVNAPKDQSLRLWQSLPPATPTTPSALRFFSPSPVSGPYAGQSHDEPHESAVKNKKDRAWPHRG